MRTERAMRKEIRMKEIFRKSILYFIIISTLTIGCDEMTEYVEVKDTSNLQTFEGKKVTIEGSISDIFYIRNGIKILSNVKLLLLQKSDKLTDIRIVCKK